MTSLHDAWQTKTPTMSAPSPQPPSQELGMQQQQQQQQQPQQPRYNMEQAPMVVQGHHQRGFQQWEDPQETADVAAQNMRIYEERQQERDNKVLLHVDNMISKSTKVNGHNINTISTQLQSLFDPVASRSDIHTLLTVVIIGLLLILGGLIGLFFFVRTAVTKLQLGRLHVHQLVDVLDQTQPLAGF